DGIRDGHVTGVQTCALPIWPEFYLKSREEMMQLFGEVEHALDRTWDIAQRCHIKLDPVAEPFPKFPIPENHTADTFFEYVARQEIGRASCRERVELTEDRDA